MKLDNYGVFVISNLAMRRMPISHLLQEFRERGAGWEIEQRIRLDWLRTKYPPYYQSVLSGDIDASVLFDAACHISGVGLSQGGGASIWVNGHRTGAIEYSQTREFSKMIAKFYYDMAWAKDAFLAAHPGFKKNIETYMWVRRL
jgi:hypothetical protein